MQFGICAGPADLTRVSEAGYDYIELGITGALQPERPEAEVMPPLLADFSKSPLHSEAYNLLLPGDLKVVGPQTDTSRQERYLASAFARASALGGKVAVFGSGGARGIPEGWAKDKAEEQVVAFLHRAGDAAARHGMVVAIEPLNTSECNFINSVAEGAALARLANHPAVGVLSDLYHVDYEGQSYEETRVALPWLHHVHIAGEGRRAPETADHAFLRDYFAVLKSSGYTGRVSIEARWEDLAGQMATSLEVMREAWEAA
jgi:sugar phosphate isomerase/epimerase